MSQSVEVNGPDRSEAQDSAIVLRQFGEEAREPRGDLLVGRRLGLFDRGLARGLLLAGVRACAHRIDVHVVRDPVHPRRQPILVGERWESRVDAQEGLLQELLGIHVDRDTAREPCSQSPRE